MAPTRSAREALTRLQAAVATGSWAPVAERHRVRLLVLFGSAVNPSTEPADLDLAVDADDLDVLALFEDLYALTGFEGIDVLDLRRAGIVARGEALGWGRPLYEDPPGRFAEAQVVALAILWDTRWLRDLELERLRG